MFDLFFIARARSRLRRVTSEPRVPVQNLACPKPRSTQGTWEGSKKKKGSAFRSQDRYPSKPRNDECEKAQFASECLNIRDGLFGNHQLTFEISEFNFLTSTCHFWAKGACLRPRPCLSQGYGRLVAREKVQRKKRGSAFLSVARQVSAPQASSNGKLESKFDRLGMSV